MRKTEIQFMFWLGKKKLNTKENLFVSNVSSERERVTEREKNGTKIYFVVSKLIIQFSQIRKKKEFK